MRSSLFAASIAALVGLAAATVEAAPVTAKTDLSGFNNIQLAQAQMGKQTTVRVKSAVLRAGPTTSSKKLASLRRGTKVQVLEQAGDQWTKVRAGKQEGYVSSSLLNQ